MCALLLAVYGVLMHSVVVVLHMADFGIFYCSVRSFVQGRDMYGPCTTTVVALGRLTSESARNLNPPHAHLPWLPLAFLAPEAALAIWYGVGLLALLASVWLIIGAIGITLSALRLLALVVAVLVFSPTGAVLLAGESTFLLLLPFTLAWVTARQGRWVVAGVLLGLAMSVKPFLLIFLPYLLLRRRFRALGASIATGIFCFAVGLLVFGIPAHYSWLTTLGAVNWTCQEYNASLQGQLTRLLARNICGPSLLDLPWLVGPAWIVAASLVGFLTLVGSVYPKSKAESVDRSFGILVLAALLISPLGWLYYLWLAVGSLVTWFAARRSLSLWQQGILTTVLPCLVGPFSLGTAILLPSAVAGGVQTWAVLGLWVVLIADGLVASLHDCSAVVGSRTSRAWRWSWRPAYSGLRRLQNAFRWRWATWQPPP